MFFLFAILFRKRLRLLCLIAFRIEPPTDEINHLCVLFQALDALGIRFQHAVLVFLFILDFFGFFWQTCFRALWLDWLDQDTNCTFPSSHSRCHLHGLCWCSWPFLPSILPGAPNSWMNLPFRAGFSGLVSIILQCIFPKTPLRTVHGCDFLSWIKSRLCQYFVPELALKFDWEFFLQHFPDLVWASKISSIYDWYGFDCIFSYEYLSQFLNQVTLYMI